MRRPTLLALDRRHWAVALLAAAGLTLLVASALSLFAPPELLDAAVALGDARLCLALAALFVISACAIRIAARVGNAAEELAEEELQRNQIYFQSVKGEPLPESPARTYLR